MSVAHNAHQEFWRPAIGSAPAAASDLEQACESCGTEFMVGSRFCHICGTARHAHAEGLPARSWTNYLQFHAIQEGLGLPSASLVAFIVGLACVVGALATGIVYSERNVLEWQAVQLFRMQWLLGGLVAFVAGVLLKKSDKK